MDTANDRRYQVFVSSTFVDLEAERRKVLDAILETQLFPAGMELFPSADEEQFAFIKREIDSSDYYMVIVAGRLVNFYSNPDELKAQVLHALNSSFRLKPQTGWVRATQARRLEDLEEIARLQKRLMEAEAELARLKELSQDPKRLLASGEDSVVLTFQLRTLGISPDFGADPPFPQVDLSFTWDELLASLFRPEEQDLPRYEIKNRLLDRVLRALTTDFPEAEAWTQRARMAGSEIGIDGNSVNGMLRRVAAQFRGLGFVELIGNKDADWRITPEALTRLALILGGKRAAGV